MSTMGERIRRLRTAAGMTQESLARAVNKTTGTVGKWERDVDTPSIASLRSLAQVLKRTADYIIGAPPPPP